MSGQYGTAARRLFGAALLAAASINAMSLNLSQSYEGQSFFDGWVWNASVIDNSTQGNIQYVQLVAVTLLSSVSERDSQLTFQSFDLVFFIPFSCSYLSREAATASNLTYINSASNAIIKVNSFLPCLDSVGQLVALLREIGGDTSAA